MFIFRKVVGSLYLRLSLFGILTILPFYLFSSELSNEKWKELNLVSINKIAENTLYIDDDLASEMAEYVATKSKESKNTEQEAKSLKILCEIFTKKGDLNQTIKYTERINQLANEYKNSSYISACYHYCYGLINLESNDYVMSADYLFEALTLFEEAGATIEQIKTNTLIGVLFFKQRSFEKSMQFYQQSLDLSQSSNFDLGVAASLNNIAAIKNATEDYKDAEKYFQQALEINKKFNNHNWIIINYLNLGVIAGKLGNFERQKLNFEKCLALCDSLHINEIKAKCYLSYAETYIDRGNLSSAFYYLQKGKQIIEDHNIFHEKMSMYDILTSYYLLRGDTTNAFLNSTEANYYKDSLYSHQRLQQLYLKEFAHNLKSKESKIKLQIERQKWILIVLLTIISLITALAYIYFLKSKVRLEKVEIEKSNAHKALDVKNKELTSKSLFISEKNQAITYVAQQLNELSNSMINLEDRRKVKQLSMSLKRHNNEDDWEEFEFYFTSVYPEFNKKIRALHPDLSPAELKLCTFLKLNMTSKDISTITGQQITSLEVARSRLRKKLGINNSNTNLSTYINSI